MDVIEKPLNAFNQRLRYEKHKYPQCSCNKCFKFFFNALFVSSRGQGKTYSCCSLIRHYEENNIIDENGNKSEIRTWLISPTSEANTVFKALKSLDDDDIRDDYSDDILEDILNQIKQVREESIEWRDYKEAYKRYIKLPEDKLHKLSNEDLYILSKNDFTDPKLLTPPRFENPPINIIILDDVLGSSCFSNKKQSFFQKQLIQNRHHQIVYMMLVQNIKAVNKSIRLNCSLFWIGKFANIKKVVEDVYEEVSSSLTENEFINLYLHCINKQYGAFVIDMTDKKKRFLCNFDAEISIK